MLATEQKETPPTPFYNNLYVVMFVATLLNAVAQFCYKLGADDFLRSPAVWVGIAIYILAFPLTLHTYRLCALSKAFPLLSLTLIWSAILAVVYLGETITLVRLFGAVLIIIGSSLVGSEA